MADPDFPPVAYAGLKREELHRTGSVVLHEYDFGALGGDGNAERTASVVLSSAQARNPGDRG